MPNSQLSTLNSQLSTLNSQLSISLLTLCLTLFAPSSAFAQSSTTTVEAANSPLRGTGGSELEGESPVFVPLVKMEETVLNGEKAQYVELNKLYIYPPREFKNDKERKKYTRLIYNIKKVLPIAKEVRGIVIETYEVVSTIPKKKDRDAHLKLVEQELKKTYTPRMKKLTLTQGKLLIKLVYRETQSSGYGLLKAFLGPVRAGFYQAFAWTFGASLAKKYDPEGEDKELERVVRQVEAGQI